MEMKKVLMLVCVLVFMGITQEVEAKGVIIYHNGPTISKVADLPTEATIENSHVNLGVMYDQFGLFWLPVWNYGETRYVLVDDAENTYWDLDEEELQSIKEEFSLDVSNEPSVPLMSQVGLKPVIAILLGFIVWGQFGKKKEEKEENEEVEEENVK